MNLNGDGTILMSSPSDQRRQPKKIFDTSVIIKPATNRFVEQTQLNESFC